MKHWGLLLVAVMVTGCMSPEMRHLRDAQANPPPQPQSVPVDVTPDIRQFVLENYQPAVESWMATPATARFTRGPTSIEVNQFPGYESETIDARGILVDAENLHGALVRKEAFVTWYRRTSEDPWKVSKVSFWP